MQRVLKNYAQNRWEQKHRLRAVTPEQPRAFHAERAAAERRASRTEGPEGRQRGHLDPAGQGTASLLSAKLFHYTIHAHHLLLQAFPTRQKITLYEIKVEFKIITTSENKNDSLMSVHQSWFFFNGWHLKVSKLFQVAHSIPFFYILKGY